MNKSYWLATAEYYRKAIDVDQTSIEGSVPIFQGKPFNDVMAQSPWITPIESVSTIPTPLLQQGMILSSLVPLSDVLRHLQSLLIAFLDGDEVLFRFYDPKVLAPLLPQFTHTEINAFLGNISTWTIWNGTETYSFSQSDVYPFTLQTSVWWRINPAYMNPLYQVDVHTFAIERRLWETCPKHMRLYSITIRKLIQEALKEAKQQHASYADAELYTLSKIIDHQCISKETLMDALSINNQVRQQFDTLGERLSWL